METTPNVEMSQLASEIATRISNLHSLFAMDLEGEIDELKKALKENPNAAMLLKDEDIGILVTNLRRTVTIAVEETEKAKAVGKKGRTSAAKKQMSADELEEALAKEGF